MMIQPVAGRTLRPSSIPSLQARPVTPLPRWHQPLPRFGEDAPRKISTRSRLRNIGYRLMTSLVTITGTVAVARYSPVFHNELYGPIRHVQSASRPYQSPTSPQDYLENRDASLQHPMITAAWRLPEKRAAINRSMAQYRQTGDITHLSRALDRLNPHLRYRTILAPGSQKQLEHDQLVQRFLNHPQVRFVFMDRDMQTWELDESTRLAIAARIVDLTHNRWDQVERRLSQPGRPLNIVVFENLDYKVFWSKKNYAGYVGIANADIGMDQSQLWASLIDSRGNRLLEIHEFAHYLDMVHVPFLSIFMPDGQLPGLSREDRRTVSSEYNRLREHYRATGNTSGLDEYAYTNYIEFLADTRADFYSNPTALHNASPNVYDVYKRYFKLDPLNGYQDLP